MYNFKEYVLNGNSYPLSLIFILALILQLNGCSDSGSVGGAIDDDQANLQVDTLEATQFGTEMLNSYTGNNRFISAGRFQDPLFGDIFAMGLFKPILADNSDTLSFNQDTEMILRLSINGETTYGDSLANVTYNLVEIAENWRAPAWRLNDEIQLFADTPVASFTVADKDTIEIPLSDEWVQKYGEFYNQTDSTRRSDYLDQFYGLAIVPQNSGRIITINPDSTEIQINNVEAQSDIVDDDTLRARIFDYAFSVDRTNEADIGPETTKIYNTLERVITLDFDFSSDAFKSINIAKAELVIYRDSLMLGESISQAGENTVRPSAGPLRLHLVEGDELPQSIDPGSPIAGGNYSEKDQAYHFNLTNLISQGFFQQADSSLKLYITQRTNGGVIRSNLLFNNQSGENSPKLIITSTNNR